MMKIGRGLLALILVAAVMASFAIALPMARSSSTDGIELLYFHRTDRCQSCNNAEQFARDTLNTYFPDQMKLGTLSIRSIDYQKDKEMAEKYNVRMQGLKLRIVRNGQESVKDVPEIWAYVKDKAAYESYLKNLLAQELGG